MAKTCLIIGPSHIMRWIHGINTEILPSLDFIDLYGKGGNPIWSQFSQIAEDDYYKYDKIIHIVGDFRFGNKSLAGNSDQQNQFGIEKELINHHNDEKMYAKVIEKCSELVNRYGNKIQFLFWDLALRENFNKNNSRYTFNGTYEHPIWNLSTVENFFPKNVISLTNVNVSNFYIDSSNHPSIQGYQYLYRKLVHDQHGFSKIEPITINIQSDITLCGDSVFIRSFNFFIDLGIIKSRKLDEVFLSNVDSYAQNSNKKIIFFSNIRSINDNDASFLDRLDTLYNAKCKNNFDVVLWDAYAQEIISHREKAYSKYNPKRTVFKTNNLSKLLSDFADYFPDTNSKLAQSFVELNVGLQPTFLGLLWGLFYFTGSLDVLHHELKIFRAEFPHLDDRKIVV